MRFESLGIELAVRDVYEDGLGPIGSGGPEPVSRLSLGVASAFTAHRPVAHDALAARLAMEAVAQKTRISRPS